MGRNSVDLSDVLTTVDALREPKVNPKPDLAFVKPDVKLKLGRAEGPERPSGRAPPIAARKAENRWGLDMVCRCRR